MGRPKEADEWMDKMVKTMEDLARAKEKSAKANPKSATAKQELAKANSELAKAYVWYGRYLLICGAGERALQANEMALMLAPDDQEGLYWAAQCALSLKQLDKSREYARRGIRLYKTDARMYLTLADIETHSGNRKAAVAKLQEGLQATNHHPEILWRLANLYLDDRDFFQARKAIQELRLRPIIRPFFCTTSMRG